MKTIKLKEEQIKIFNRLIESESAPDFEDGDIKEYGDSSENGISATIHDDEGNPKYGSMPDSMADKISSRMTPQSYWAQATNGRRITAY